MTFKVIQGNWQWRILIGHIQFQCSIATMSLSCTANEIITTYLPKFKEFT